LLRYDRNLIDATEIIPFGDAKSVRSAVKVLRDAGKKALAVRDADQGEDAANLVFSLPGEHAPEKEVFLSDEALSILRNRYAFDLADYLVRYPETNHHDYAKIIAEKKSYSREVVESDCIRAFLDARGEDWYGNLCESIARNL
jgi:hypothetical protein